MSSNVEHDAYKYQWARFVAREKLDADFRDINEKLSAQEKAGPLPSLSALAAQYFTPELTGPKPPKDGEFKVGIVGAGAAGLFTALTLDFLRRVVPDLKISYDILEASGKERLGGRLYTHKFSEKPHDYYDVGAMRFPENKIMARTFQLFEFLGLKDKLVKYYLDDFHDVCPTYFNDVLWIGSPPKGANDPYGINRDLGREEPIPEYLIKQNPSDVINEAIKELREELKKDLDSKDRDEGWKLLMKADFMSARQFFRSDKNEGFPNGPNFSFNTIEWLETFAYATGWYNQSLSETVLESLDFDVSDATAEDPKWLCLEGGTQQVAEEMAKKLSKQPEFNRQVTAIEADPSLGMYKLTMKNPKESAASIEQREYFAVFNSTTLGALQRMDLTKAGIPYRTKQAIRSLGYGASCKVAIKFSKAWWMMEPHNINLGGTSKTDLPLRVCVYPSYNIHDNKEESAVLLCSYTWAQDAQRIATLISSDSPNNEEDLKTVLCHNLALMHATPKKSYAEVLKTITSTYLTHHAYDWYNDRNMSGAFAYFGPGQFSEMWPEITRQNGWLFCVGEAASAHHAWIVGSLESAVRGVYQMLESLHLQNPTFKPYRDAMEWLTKDDASAHPFGPLPREMPERQKGTDRDAEKKNLPGKDIELTFTAAQVILSFLETRWEQTVAQKAELPSR